MARLVTVMPDLRAGELGRQRAQRLLDALGAARHPSAAARSTCPRSTVTKANSAATKTPQASDQEQGGARGATTRSCRALRVRRTGASGDFESRPWVASVLRSGSVITTVLSSRNPPAPGDAAGLALCRPRPPPGRGTRSSPCLWHPRQPRRTAPASSGPPLPGSGPCSATSARLLVSRFSYGVTPGAGAAGRREGWRPRLVRVAARRRTGSPTRDLVGLDQWWPGLAYSGLEAWERHASEVEPGWVLTANYQRWLLQRRMRTRRQVHEVMTEFWEHHLHVPANGEPAFVYRKAYGDAIRQHALGTFEELLQAAILHPAMLIFLEQRGLDEAPPEREPRPRAAGAAHGRARQPHRGRRQELRPDPHRLARGHVGHLGRLVRARRPLDRPGHRPGVHRRRTPTATVAA